MCIYDEFLSDFYEVKDMYSKKELININKEFEGNINYEFKDKELLLLALTHSSYTNENKKHFFASNERLEFLGDAVLSVVISEFLYSNNKDMAEGDMSKIRSGIVCETSLAMVSKNIDLDKFLLFGKGEELTGGRNRESILADAFEALLGAIYLDSDINTAKQFILSIMKDIIKDVIDGVIFIDFKTKLQEKVQHDGVLSIRYNIIDERGPDHDKVFKANVEIEGKVMGEGFGRTKKEAEQNAAKEALGRIINE